MTCHYFAHAHSPSLPHLQCMLSSIRAFDPHSPFTVVVDNQVNPAERHAIGDRWRVQMFTMGEVDADCRDTLPWWDASRNKSPRDRAWMMQACLPWWMLLAAETDWLVYVDSDVYFFQSLQPIIDALPATAHVGICPHHYPPGKENISAGRFNNGLVIWRNSEISRAHALRWGRETIERWNPNHWRAVTHEQKLLDEWPEQLGNACIEMPRGCDVGPWQLATCVSVGAGPIIEHHLGHGELNIPVQSWHFHEHRPGAGRNPVKINGQQWNRSGYDLHPETIESVYKPYERELARFV